MDASMKTPKTPNQPDGPDGLDASRRELADRIARWTRTDPMLDTDVPGLWLRRYEAPTEPASYMHEPSLCLVAQGAKRVLLSDEEYVYDANHYLITSVGLPVVANVTEASEDVPFLGLVMKLDLGLAAQLLVDAKLPMSRMTQSSRGMAVSAVTEPLFRAFARLVDLLDEPENIPILAPLLSKEILYRLLIGEQGPRLRQMAMSGSHGSQIAQAIDWLKRNYSKSLRIEDLASRASMSPSAFHQHFKTLTAMSPLQYQKWLRLNEARRLMLAERQDATSAAFQVGYESPSQFSREYRRLFGSPPLRDIRNLHQTGPQEARAES